MFRTDALSVKQVKEARYFFYTQAFADGLRTALAILLPALIGSYLGHFETGLTISLGAMCTALTDAPGPVLHKRNGMLFAVAFAFTTAVITALARTNAYLLGIEVAAVTFFFSMFVVYGPRATAVGNTAILVMILTMDKQIAGSQVLLHAAQIAAGGVFYLVISLLLYHLQPYRAAQRALGDCIREIATFLSIRAEFYNPSSDIEANYSRMLAQQIVVNERQDLVRELFFKTRQIVEESTSEGRKLVFTFVESVDLFEDITTAYYDYRSLRILFGDSSALEIIHRNLQLVVTEINAVGIAIHSNTAFRKSFDYNEAVRRMKAEIDAIAVEGKSKSVLRRIVVNFRNLLLDLDNIEEYFATGVRRKASGVDHSPFISHQPLDPSILRDNLNLQSSAFRHAVRVSLACIIGFLITKTVHYGEHSYWILLTIAFIIKPAFSLTKERNKHRLIGTLVGGAVGALLLLTVHNTTALFVVMVALMIGTYSFMRTNYLAMVLCTTPYVLILFSFLGNEFRLVATERILDTVIGCAIAFSLSYFLFPSWEAAQLKTLMQQLVRANAVYLQKLVQVLRGEQISLPEYKLARKEVYLHSANLSAAFQRMLSEPLSKQSSRSNLQQFVVLNHLLFSNVATLTTSLLSKEASTAAAPELVHTATKALIKLEEVRHKLGDENRATTAPSSPTAPTEMAAADDLTKEQLNFIYSVSKDIGKTAASLV